MEHFDEPDRKVRPELIRRIAIRLMNREIGGHGPLWLDGGLITGTVMLDDIDLPVPLFLMRCTIPALNFSGACNGMDLSHSTIGPVDAERCHVRGHWQLNNAEVNGKFNILGATVDGQFAADESTFEVADGVAIRAQDVTAESWFMDKASVKGQFNINSATLKGQFRAEEAAFEHAGGVAIVAFDLKAGRFFLRKARTCDGAIDLAGTDIGLLHLDNLAITAAPGFSLRLERAKIGSLLRLRRLKAVGAVVLRDVTVEGRVELAGAELSAQRLAGDAPEPPAGLHPTDADLAAEMTDFALDLSHAVIGRLVMPEQPPRGIVNLSRAKVGTFEDRAEGWMPALGRNCRSCPQRAHWSEEVGPAIHYAHDCQHLILDGFTYDYLANPFGGVAYGDGVETRADWQARVRWLRGQHNSALHVNFNPQPWQQLAKTLRAMGHDEAARYIAIQRRVNQRLAKSTTWFHRGVSWVLHVLSDYGFHPWKTVGWAIAAVVAFGAIYGVQTGVWGWSVAVPDFIRTAAGDVYSNEFQQTAYPAFNPWLYSLDLFIPVLDLGMDSYWRPESNLFYALAVVEQFLGAFLVALAVTGFTGLLSKEDQA